MKHLKLLALALLFAFAASLSGCGQQSPKTAATVEIFQYKSEFKEPFEKLAKTYMASHPDVIIQIITVGGGNDYTGSLKAKFQSGSEPAIFNVGGPQEVMDWQSKIVDLGATAAAKAAVEGVLDGATLDGKVFGLPYCIEGYGFIYNKAIFKKAGINPDNIKSFSALTAAVKTLDTKKSELGLKAVFAYALKETWVAGMHTANPYLAAEFGNINNAFAAKEIKFTYGAAFKNMVDLQNKYSVQPTVSTDYSMEVEELFSNGKVALIQQGNWLYSTLAGADKAFAQTGIGILPFPVEGWKEDCIPVGVPMYWCVNKNKDEVTIKAAKDFLDWMYTSEEGKKTCIHDFKFIPAYKNYDVSGLDDDVSKTIYKYITDNKTIPWVFMGCPTNWAMDKLGTGIQKYVTGNISWNELMTSVEKSWAQSRSK
ncbi:MAG: extracellular solute-binding protein [Negativicutes bacterium]|jgi:raffinose/stachyose/melibiose transport system substrate-binding protein